MNKHTGPINSDTFSSILMITIIFFIQVLLPAATNITAPVNQKLAAEREAVAIEEMQEAAEEDSILTSAQPNLLLALSAAFTLNFIVILAYSHKKKNEDVEMMSGTCSHFEIKKPEIS